MSHPNLVIRGQKVVFSDSIRPASIHISGETVANIAAFDDVPAGCDLVEASDDDIVMAGLVDTHVHINEPGRTDWEGFQTATRAAAAGGVTTLVDMPLNSIPPTTTPANLEAKLKAARGQCYVDVGFWGGVIPGNARELRALSDAGVVGFKCFLIHSGVDEFPNVTEADLREALPELKRLDALLIVHAEVPGPIESAGIPACPTSIEEAATAVQNGARPTSSDRKVCPTAYETFLASRPRAAEDEAVALMIKLSREFGNRVHIVHHSSADALPLLREARAAGLNITAETCPHYLTIAAEEIPDGATEFKCCPPIRERENCELLWSALEQGTIDMIVSDHSPCPPEMKLKETGDFLAAWGGISSLQLRLPIIWTEGRRRGHTIQEIAKWLCSAPASLVGLKRKGLLAEGFDADVVIWNPDAEFRVDGKALHHRHKLTPYQNRSLQGVVKQTILRGKKIYDDGEFSVEPSGRLLL